MSSREEMFRAAAEDALCEVEAAEAMLMQMELEEIRRSPILECTCGLECDPVIVPENVVADRDRHGIQVRSILCLTCGTIRLDWQPADGWLYTSGWYRKLHTQRGDEAARRQWQRAQWEYLAELLSIDTAPDPMPVPGWGSLIELGADTGGFCEGARAAGWSAHPIEIDQPIPGGADMYIGVHVLEHIPDPVAFLRMLLGKQAKKVAMVVPDLLRVHMGEDCDPAGPRKRGDMIPACAESLKEGGLQNWWTIAHPWNWTMHSVAYPFLRAGWVVQRIRTVPPGPLATVGSLLVEAIPGPDAERVRWYVARWTR